MKIKYIAGVMLLAAGIFSLSSCNSDDDYASATGNILSSVVTGDATVTATTATTAGTVLDLSSQESSAYSVGVIYSTSADPTTSGTKKAGTIDESGNVSTSLTGLTKGVTYYYATYVTLQGYVTKFGDVKSFVTTDAKMTTADATNVTAVSATLGGSANTDVATIYAGQTTLTYGVKLAASKDDVTSGREYTVSSDASKFTTTVKGLLPNTTYYYAPFFEMADGYVYGDIKSFKTSSMEMEYVDLGLSVAWAKCNLGATSETEAGGLYGWADLTGLATSQLVGQYKPASDISNTENDLAAVVGIDGSCAFNSMTPTKAQVDELISGTTQKWTTVDGVYGCKFTGTNGNSIFMPAAGYRNGTVTSDENTLGDYWTGSVNPSVTDYGSTLTFSESGSKSGYAYRSYGLSIRPVRHLTSVKVDNTKLNVGDIENNGNIRIEIYNEYGSTKANPGINPNLIYFLNKMSVTFKLSGITFKSGASTKYPAGLEYAANGWSPSYWSSLSGDSHDAVVTGNGTYTVTMETGGAAANGAIVFCIDIKNLAANVTDISSVKAEITSINFE
ncbi:MAG: hypothetical protein LKG25_00880 [Prevotella sp.]|jgi:hypothetical protein|nr:hypothetical protein [Prevotella sp.]MCI1281131.1 hypothetical protein [Prevotella sp.]